MFLRQTVLEETKKNSLAAYRRLRKLLQDETRAFVFLANDHHAETYINKVRGVRAIGSYVQSVCHRVKVHMARFLIRLLYARTLAM
jgi:hypothetical protein